MSRNPLQIADRMSSIEASGIRKFFDLARTMKDPINLSIGQPHFDPPAIVADAAIAAIRSGENKYTPTQGIEPLRVKLREKLAKRYPIAANDDLMITGGVAGGVLLSYFTTLNPGDEILIPDPYFVMYKHLAHVAGAKPVLYATYPDFRITREALEKVYTPKTRALLVNSPSNPTGQVMNEAEVRLVAEFARERGLLLISDEIYDEYIYEGEHISPKRYNPDTLVLGGFSKSMGIPGWRMGYALGPAPILEKMRILQQFSYVCAPAPAQFGVLAGLDFDFTPYRKEYRAKRDRVYEGLRENFNVVKPSGAFYIFPELPKGISDQEFVQRCIERSLLVVPGSACCSKNNYVRVSYAADDRTLDRGIAVLNDVVKSFR
ncbi:MAG: pyridoxal phosphate-dependent aminotransferase [Planctomycetes bacterium]|nr:pyridoxal phosphate-dependent aminotransferase [Planctomycetota bacterium]NUQ34740.1 pyridoxal phosphate-dependent aminotransferase [Planctomycetaceae bacterium]